MRWSFLGLNISCFLAASYAIYRFWPIDTSPTLNEYLFPGFLIVFCLLFLLITLYLSMEQARAIKKGVWEFYTFNGVIMVLFIITYFYSERAYTESIIDDPIELHSVIYKIDAKSLHSPRHVYYMYRYGGTEYQDKFYDDSEEYVVGDSVLIKVSTNYPSKNKVLGAIKKDEE